MNRDHSDGAGIHLLGLLSLLFGLPVAIGLGFLLPEYGPGFFPLAGTPRGDVAGRGLALATLAGCVTGLLAVAAGVSLLVPRWRRFVIALSLMIAAALAALAMVAVSLWGGLMGDSKGGMKEAYLIVLALPIGVVLLLLSVAGVWLLRSPAIRRALEARRGS